jgi:hypothetical protein
MMLIIFSFAYKPFFRFSLENCPFSPFAHLLIGLFSQYWVARVLYSGYKFLIRYMTCTHFLLFYSLFHFLDGIIYSIKVLSFGIVHFTKFFLSLLMLLVSYLKKPLSNPKSWRFSAMLFLVVLALRFWALIHVELIFVYHVR